MASDTQPTREQIVEIVGRIDDEKIARIVATGASAAEILEAHTGTIEQGDLEAETERRMSGTVAEVYDILLANEPKWPEGSETP